MTGTGGRPQNKVQSTLRGREYEIRTMPVAIWGAYALGNNSNIQKMGNYGVGETAQMLGTPVFAEVPGSVPSIL